MDKSPVIELFSIGTELTLGQIQDTNAHWIAQQILQLGGQLRRVTMLRDEFEEMFEAISDAIARKTDLILTTGGLGPTPDDMTVEVVAKIIGRPTIVHEATLSSFMERRQITNRDDIGPALISMATVPEGADVFQNPVGWAPCIRVVEGDSSILLMPGPPREMKSIFETYITPLIAERYSSKTATRRVYVNMFEAEVSPLLQQVMGEHPGTYLKAYVALRRTDGQFMPVDLVSTGADEVDAASRLEKASEYFRTLVVQKSKVFSLEEQ